MESCRVSFDLFFKKVHYVESIPLSDQEVIAFLDERVHELETSLDKTKQEMGHIQSSLNKGITTTEKQVVVLRDLLSFEREYIATILLLLVSVIVNYYLLYTCIYNYEVLKSL